jgi:DnaJ-domain-containing protein 1
MEMTEWVVIIVCGFLGYWIVSWLADRQKLNEEKVGREREGHGHQTSNADHQSVRESHWGEVLGIPTSASVDEVKHAYRVKIQQYHPDRLEGMAPELRQLAIEKSQRINAAYTEAIRMKS